MSAPTQDTAQAAPPHLKTFENHKSDILCRENQKWCYFINSSSTFSFFNRFLINLQVSQELGEIEKQEENTKDEGTSRGWGKAQKGSGTN